MGRGDRQAGVGDAEVTKAKTGDEKEYTKITKMSMKQLLDYVISNPHLLTDSYYKGYDTAIYKRHEELSK